MGGADEKQPHRPVQTVRSVQRSAVQRSAVQRSAARAACCLASGRRLQQGRQGGLTWADLGRWCWMEKWKGWKSQERRETKRRGLAPRAQALLWERTQHSTKAGSNCYDSRRQSSRQCKKAARWMDVLLACETGLAVSHTRRGHCKADFQARCPAPAGLCKPLRPRPPQPVRQGVVFRSLGAVLYG